MDRQSKEILLLTPTLEPGWKCSCLSRSHFYCNAIGLPPSQMYIASRFICNAVERRRVRIPHKSWMFVNVSLCCPVQEDALRRADDLSIEALKVFKYLKKPCVRRPKISRTVEATGSNNSMRYLPDLRSSWRQGIQEGAWFSLQRVPKAFTNFATYEV